MTFFLIEVKCDVILINLFLSLSSETVFRRRPPPIAVSAVAYEDCTNGQRHSIKGLFTLTLYGWAGSS